MEFKKIFDAMKHYSSVYKEANETFAQSRKKIHNEYGDTKAGAKMLSEAAIARDAAIEEAKKNGLKTVDMVFADLNKQITAVVTAPVPADFPSTLEAIRATGKGLSAEEAEVYIGKYNGNYTAYRAIAAALKEVGVCKVYPVTYEQVKEDSNTFYAWSEKFFRSKPTTYMSLLLLAEKNPMRNFERNINYFLNGDMLSYGKNTDDGDNEAAK